MREHKQEGKESVQAGVYISSGSLHLGRMKFGKRLKYESVVEWEVCIIHT